jgi:type I restriction enzyme S subunit
VNLKEFLDNLRYMANAPHGVKRLREMILHLAVSGALVEQVAADGFSEDDISEAEALRDRYRQRIKVRQGREHGPIRSDEKPFAIPESWRWARLERIACYIQRGKSPIYSQHGRARIVSQKCIQWSGFDLTPARHISDDSLDRYGEERFLIEKDILWNSTGTGTAGRVVVFPVVTSLVVADSHVTVIRLTNFDAKFLWCYLASPIIQARTQPGHEESLVSGTTNQVELSTTKVAELPIPCPPVTEQQRIVAKVEELMALCDKLEAQQLERERRFPVLTSTAYSAFVESPTPSNINFIFEKLRQVSPASIKRAVAMLALRGDISVSSKEDGTSDALLDELDTQRQRFSEEMGVGLPRLRGYEGGFPFTLKASWSWVRLNRLFNVITDGDHQPPPRSPSGIAFLTIGNITSGVLDFTDSRFVSESYYAGLAFYRRPRKGDILYTVVGATYGRPALVETDRRFCVQRHIAILKPAQGCNVRFLLLLLKSPFVYDQATRGTTGIAQPTVPLSALRNFLVPLPPRAEQDRIVKVVDRLTETIETLEEQQRLKDQVADSFVKAALAAITCGSTQEPAQMKAPKTELVTRLQADRKPDSSEKAPLATLLAENDGALSAKALWRRSGLAIDAFYQQLKTEMAQGWIVEPEPAAMCEVAAD